MRHKPSSLVLVSLLAACSAQQQAFAPAAPAAKKAAASAEHPVAKADRSAAQDNEPAAPSHVVGDYLVRRFTVRSRASMTVSERVVAVKDGSVVLEVTRQAGNDTKAIRVELSEGAATRGEVISATVLEGGVEVATGKDAYEAIMGAAAFVADENEGEIERGNTKLEVHGRAVECTETSFHVRVQGKQATMRTFELTNSPWGEVGAEVTTAQGTVLYKAELIDVGRDESRSAALAIQ